MRVVRFNVLIVVGLDGIVRRGLECEEARFVRWMRT